MAEFRDSIEIAAPPSAVFEHLVTETGITAWMATRARLEPHPGGTFAVEVAGHPVRGRFLEVEHPRRVVVSWGFAGDDELPPGASRVTFELTPVAGGTRVDLTHTELPETGLPGHADGWRHFLPRLATAGRGEDPGPDHWQPATHRDTRR